MVAIAFGLAQEKRHSFGAYSYPFDQAVSLQT
jgi:hypothetical protein